MEPSDLKTIKDQVMRGDNSLNDDLEKTWNLFGGLIQEVYAVINRKQHSRGLVLHPVRPTLRQAAGAQLKPGTHGTEPVADVVFVHGLDGNAFDTWQFDPRWPFDSWPFWLAADLPHVNVWTLSYPAARRDRRGYQGLPLETLAEGSLNALKDRNVGERPLVFVAHSLGGLVVKKMTQLSYLLVDPGHEHRSLTNNLRGVVFLGTPHNGAYLGTLAHKWSLVYPSTATIEYLRQNHPTIDELGRWFRQFADLRREISIHAHRETAKLVILKIWRTLVVDPASADPGINQAKILDAAEKDHITICKCNSRDDPVFKNTRDMILTIAPRPAARPIAPATGHSREQ
jgi:hypothetical protein